MPKTIANGKALKPKAETCSTFAKAIANSAMIGRTI
jgi:hypothetical protein